MKNWISWLLLYMVSAAGWSQTAYVLKNISYQPGQKLFVGLESNDLGAPLKILVSDSTGKPMAGVSVKFEIVGKPGKSHGEKLHKEIVETNAEGIAENGFVLGDQAGDYLIIAHTEGMVGETPVILVRAQRTLWWMFLVIGLFGGLGIFLYGMGLGSGGLQKIAGERLRTILAVLTSNRFLGLLVGIVITAIVQSSSATSVMVVGLVSSSLMTLTQAIGVLMGAHIGTTITVQLIAFNVSDYSLLLVGAGFLITLITKRKFYIYLGEIILGFGFIFFGMAVMSQAIGPLKSMPAFIAWLLKFGESPLLGILASTLFTGIIQSSGATIGLCVVMASEGLLSFESAMPLVFGANIGTCMTALLSAIGATTDGKRTALAHTLFSVIGVVLFTPFLIPFENVIRTITHAMGTDAVPRLIANGHMFFNIFNAAILIAFVPVTAKLITKMIPEKAESKEFKPKYLNNAYLETPEIALQQAQLEENRLMDVVRQMYATVPVLFKQNNEIEVAKMQEHMKNVNMLEGEIRRYLTRLSQKSISLTQSRRLMRLLLTIDDIRHISNRLGDYLPEIATKLSDNKWTLPEADRKDFETFLKAVGERMENTFKTLQKENKQEAEEWINTKRAMSEMEVRLREAHLQRVQKDFATYMNTSPVMLDLLTALKRVDTFCVKIAHEIVDQFKF